VQFIERAVLSIEILQDEIWRWCTYEMWLEKQFHTQLSSAQLETKWKSEVEACKSECLFAHGQWLLPRFEGIEKRVRHKQSAEIELFRGVDINSAAEMDVIWETGRKKLVQFETQFKPVQCPLPVTAEPHIPVAPEDQPTQGQVNNSLFGSIAREVSLFKCSQTLSNMFNFCSFSNIKIIK